MRASASLRHGERALGRLQHIGVEHARLLDRGEMRVGDLDGGEFLVAQALARLRERERRELGHSPSGLSQTKAFLRAAADAARLISDGAFCR